MHSGAEAGLAKKILTGMAKNDMIIWLQNEEDKGSWQIETFG